MKKKLAFALGGGGSRGALQAGALRALLQANIQPDLLVGTSIGSVNAIFMAMHGFSPQMLDKLDEAWLIVAKANLFPASTAWLTTQMLLNYVGVYPYSGIKDYFIAQGIRPDLRFGDLPHAPVILVSTDLNGRKPVYYGNDPQDLVLDGLIASVALPPWVSPIDAGGRMLVDGGMISNLPIEPALAYGATEIIAMGLSNPNEVSETMSGIGNTWTKFLNTIEARQIQLELALARARNVPVHIIDLKTLVPVPVYDFSQTQFLLQDGYRQTKWVLDSGLLAQLGQSDTWLLRLQKILQRPQKQRDKNE
ncbi:MAG: patatin-like phospholipase family protein [Chloroflexota bacterium]|jgi:NTE family protein|nr:patatin-like phospholipase family protein [Chloroflexota bacterium]